MDIWRLGIVDRTISEIISNGCVEEPVRWIGEDDRFSFLADPFGLRRGDHTYIFAEAYDYRSRVGRIDVLTLDANLTVLKREKALAEPWHLSYPFLIEAEGELWLLPEAHRSGRLTPYRCTDFPNEWEAGPPLDLPVNPVDATPVKYNGHWWLFFASGEALHLAVANHFLGPWRLHPASPLSTDPRGSRPGGSAIVVEGQIVLPVQDCVGGYGRGVRPLYFRELSHSKISAQLGEIIQFPGNAAPFDEGMHTLSECGVVTLIDMKRVERSTARHPINLLGRSRRAARQWSSRHDRTHLR